MHTTCKQCNNNEFLTIRQKVNQMPSFIIIGTICSKCQTPIRLSLQNTKHTYKHVCCYTKTTISGVSTALLNSKASLKYNKGKFIPIN